MGTNISAYLTELQLERLQAMAASRNQSVSSFIGWMIDEEWRKHIAQKQDSLPTEKETVR